MEIVLERYIVSLASVSLVIATSAVAQTSQSSLSFECQIDSRIPTTIARANQNERSWRYAERNRTQAIFHWKQEVIPSSYDAQQLCETVSSRLNDYFERHDERSTIIFHGDEQGGLPVICATDANNTCAVLFTLAPTDNPVAAANEVLTGILDRNLQSNRVESESEVEAERSLSYLVSPTDLLGINSLKSF